MPSKKGPRQSSLLLGHIDLTPKQKKYRDILLNPKTRMGLISGPAGTSKTFLAVLVALILWDKDRDLEILYLRSVVESADRSLGFLKGDLDEKLNPYLAPLEDKIDELLEPHEKDMLKKKNALQAQPINFVRGQSWRNKIVIVDEAQNLSKKELLTIITRIGRDTKLILCGDIMQSDIKHSGYGDLCLNFNDKESRDNGIHALQFGIEDVMRDPIVAFILQKLESYM